MLTLLCDKPLLPITACGQRGSSESRAAALSLGWSKLFLLLFWEGVSRAAIALLWCRGTRAILLHRVSSVCMEMREWRGHPVTFGVTMCCQTLFKKFASTRQFYLCGRSIYSATCAWAALRPDLQHPRPFALQAAQSEAASEARRNEQRKHLCPRTPRKSRGSGEINQNRKGRWVSK